MYAAVRRPSSAVDAIENLIQLIKTRIPDDERSASFVAAFDLHACPQLLGKFFLQTQDVAVRRLRGFFGRCAANQPADQCFGLAH